MPQDSKALQQKWTARITHARAHWANFHKRVRHSRNTVAGFNWNADPTSKDFYSLRANLIHGTSPQPIRARTSTLGAPLASAGNPMDRIAQHLGNMGI